MCKSTAEGGQRCPAHTRPKVTKAVAAIEAAVAAGDATAVREAREAWETAAAEYASTDEGHRHLSGQAASALAAGDYDTHALLSTMVQRGEAMRAANRETAALIKAARLSQTAPDDPAPTIGEPEMPLPAPADRPTMPDLTGEQRSQWVATLREFEDLAPDVASIRLGAARTYPRDVLTGLPKIDQTIGDPDSEDQDLSQSVHSAGYFRGSRYYVPAPEWKPVDEATADHRADRKARWEGFASRLREGLEAQADRALRHPNAGVKTYTKAEEKGFATRRDLTGRPGVPLSYLKHAIATGSHADEVHPRGWEWAREARFEDNSMALLLAAKDPDSFHRFEAFNQVVTVPFDSVSRSDRAWLAHNLHTMPGEDGPKVVLAESLMTWAKTYTDDQERNDLRAYLRTSPIAAVQEVGRAGTEADAGGRRRWRS